MRGIISTLVKCAWALAVVYAVYATSLKSNEFLVTKAARVTPPPLASVNPDLVKILSLGHHGLIEDFFNLWMVQILVEKELVAAQPDLTEQAIFAVLDHKIRIETLYMLSCFVMNSDANRPEVCERISQKGLEVFPLSWRIPMTQGYIFYKVLDLPLRASLYYSLAASREGRTPPHVIRVARKLARQEEVTEDELEYTMKQVKNFRGAEIFLQVLREEKIIPGEEE